MDGQTLGSFLVVVGLILVVVAGYYLRTRQTNGKNGIPGEKRRTAPAAGVLWVWIGRAGALLSIAGALLVVLAGRQ
ncbi:MAG: hypothetical protein GX751_08330 [Desulfuromonadaceae bacterium]|nr:hypothetical protein [Desulfuromonadaceae bacterium]